MNLAPARSVSTFARNMNGDWVLAGLCKHQCTARTGAVLGSAWHAGQTLHRRRPAVAVTPEALDHDHEPAVGASTCSESEHIVQWCAAGLC